MLDFQKLQTVGLRSTSTANSKTILINKELCRQENINPIDWWTHEVQEGCNDDVSQMFFFKTFSITDWWNVKVWKANSKSNWMNSQHFQAAMWKRASLGITVLYPGRLCLPSARIRPEYCGSGDTLNSLYTLWMLTCMREVMCAGDALCVPLQLAHWFIINAGVAAPAHTQLACSLGSQQRARVCACARFVHKLIPVSDKSKLDMLDPV